VEERLSAAVAEARRQLAAGWPLVVDTTRWSWSDGVVVSGGVLVQAQARLYAEVLQAWIGASAVPAVLSDFSFPWASHHWRALTDGPAVDLYRGPEGDDAQSQWEPPALVRWFAEQGPRALIQLPDGTLGWSDAARLAPASPDADPWAGIARARAGQTVPPSTGRPDPLAEAARRARARLGNPYRWGGNTDAAADCSGLVQSLLWQAAGVLLPKHTGDQRRLGSRIGAASIAPGDLVFVRGRAAGIAHVGLALPSPETTTVVHSCLTRNRVMEEPLGSFLERYRFTGARRPIRWTDA
jgi:cell wall-associated NlpC family hydrolase